MLFENFKEGNNETLVLKQSKEPIYRGITSYISHFALIPTVNMPSTRNQDTTIYSTWSHTRDKIQ